MIPDMRDRAGKSIQDPRTMEYVAVSDRSLHTKSEGMERRLDFLVLLSAASLLVQLVDFLI